MIDTRYYECLDFVLRSEGRFSNRAGDRGGITNYGITQRTYNTWLEMRGKSLRGVMLIAMSEVRAIYQEYFWEPVKARLLWQPLDLVLFDASVQHGPGRAARWLQQVVGSEQDGQIGPRTLTSLLNYTTENTKRDTIRHYMDIRSAFYAQIIDNDPSQEQFKKGWKNRMDRLIDVVKASV